MATKRGLTMRAQWAGRRLRAHREAAGLTLKEGAEHIQRESSTLSKTEAGVIPCRTADVLMLLNLYGVDDERERQALEQLSRDVWRKGWWEGYAGDIAGSFIDHAWLEDRAERIRSFEAIVLPGILQTEAYARATMRAAEPDATDERIEGWIDFRMQRQGILDKGEPPHLDVVVDESAVRRPVGGAAVMDSQLRRLCEYGKRPDAELRVLPCSVGEHASLYGAFTVYDLGDPFPGVAYADTLAGAVYVEADDALRFVAAHERLRAAALEPDDSLALISEIADEFD